MDIGEPIRVIEVEPAGIPIPEEPPVEPEPERENTPELDPEPVEARR